jgi:hypothetical protein
MSLKIPFRIHKGHIDRESDEKKSIDDFLELMVASRFGSFKPDRNFGFIFKNFKFENFDERNGTVSYSDRESDKNKNIYYEKKIAGSSKNPNTFAYELKRNIEHYEKRLRNVEVKMRYEQKQKIIVLRITGLIDVEKTLNYEHEIMFHVW